MDRIENLSLDQERALYALRDTEVASCAFEGPADGESALKEASGCVLDNCRFLLRYPLWHTSGMKAKDCFFADTCRAGLWYGKDSEYTGCTVEGVKFLRECDRISLKDCHVKSQEFGWKCRGIKLEDCEVESEYIFLESSGLSIRNLKMKSKYSFQYVRDMIIEDSYLDTKDAFWHSENVTVRNSTIKGEYLAWYSRNLTLENCHIIGTQPLCYCEGLKLVDCTMEGCDLSFEYSDVIATVKGNIDSVKNPKAGSIVADGVGEILMTDDAVVPCLGSVIIR